MINHLLWFLDIEKVTKKQYLTLWHMSPRENGNPGQDLVSKLENPSMFYSAVKKDKHSLRKKVVRNVITMMMMSQVISHLC